MNEEQIKESVRTIRGGIDSLYWVLDNAHNYKSDMWIGFANAAIEDRAKALVALEELAEAARAAQGPDIPWQSTMDAARRREPPARRAERAFKKLRGVVLIPRGSSAPR